MKIALSSLKVTHMLTMLNITYIYSMKISRSNDSLNKRIKYAISDLFIIMYRIYPSINKIYLNIIVNHRNRINI